MDHRLRIFKSALVFLFIVGVLFAALALLPVMAQTPGAGSAPPVPFLLWDDSVHILDTSATGYVVDNSDSTPYFQKSQPPLSTDWTLVSAGAGVNGDYFYAEAEEDDTAEDWAEWHPDLQAGWYEVWVHYVAHPNRSTDVEYWVDDYPGANLVRYVVNQQLLADGSPAAGEQESGWVRLGSHRFYGSPYVDKVRLTDQTSLLGTPDPRYVIADAVKFAPQEVWVDDDYYDGGINDGYAWGLNAFSTIQEGIAAVASNGTVWVKGNNITPYYVGPITITKGITLTNWGTASPIISVTTGTAIQVLADNVTVKGFTVRSHAAARGIANYDESTPAWIPVSSYRILNNMVRSFQQGVEFYQARGEISSNTIYSNTQQGIRIQQSPPSDPGGTTVMSNVLYGNGTDGGSDTDIEVWDSYTGTLVISNTITGGGGATEACILVRNQAGSLDVIANTVSGCTEGVLILHDAPANVIKVNMYRNVITGGTRGVRVRRTPAGTINIREILIGGSIANSNRIFGNSDYELELVGNTPNFTATYNYWGVCNWRAIEDEIRHDYDNTTLGKVVYEPALCVPVNLTVQARPTSISGDGISTATITATVTDVKGDPALPGTMIGITTTLGSVPYGYVEENDPAVVRTPGWLMGWPDVHASAGLYASAGLGECMTWGFTGTAVSLVYLRHATGGLADVYVDDLSNVLKTVDMSNSLGGLVEWLVEEVITNALSAAGQHTIMVCTNPGSPGPIWVDALRSGGTVLADGRIVTNLTSVPISDTATVWASVYTGRIITDATPSNIYQVLTDTVDVAFQGTDVYISKTASHPEVSPGNNITYTIAYGNSGPAIAKGVVITDALPLDFSYISYRATPTLPPPTVTGGITCVWSIGDLAADATGFITVVARPDPTASWPSTPDPRTNVAQISSLIYDGAPANNSQPVIVNVVPNPAATITVTAVPGSIWADGSSTSTITADVRDKYNHPILDGTPITFTTSLAGTTFQPGGEQTYVGTTTSGLAVTTLQAGTVAGHDTITVKVGTLQGTGVVDLLALEPYTVTISANPWAIPASHGTEFSTLSVTVTDQYRNLVSGAAVTLTTDAGSLVVPGVVTGTEIIITTTNGVATARLMSTESLMTATVTAAITTTGRPTATAQVYFMAALPYTITLDYYPTVLPVCGGEAVVTATIQDEFANLVEDGTAVYFDVVPGAAGEMRYRSRLTVNGVVTSVVLTKGYNLLPPSLEVVVSAGRISRRFPIDLVAGPPAEISFSMSPPAVPACGGIAEVEALVTDCAGNRVKNGTVITFSVGPLADSVVPDVTTTSNGLAYTIVRAGSAAGSTVLTATVGSIVRTFVVVIDPGPADVIYMDISPATIANCGGGSAVVTATLRDACGNLVKDGTPVVFGRAYGYVGLSVYSGFTHNGVLTTTAIADQGKPIAPGDWPLGLEQVYAYSGSALQAFQNLWIRPGEPSQIEVSIDPEEIPILGDVNGYDIIVVADTMDCSDTPVEDGTLVTLRTTKGYFRESGQFWVEQMALDGLVTGTLTSREIAGDVFITATAGSAVGTAEAYFLPGDPAYVDVWAVPPAILADGRSRTTVWVRIRDGFNNLVGSGITVTFTAARGQFLGDGNSCTAYTTIDGLASCVLVADTTPGTVIVIAETYNGVSGWFDLTFVQPHYIYVPLVRKYWAAW